MYSSREIRIQAMTVLRKQWKKVLPVMLFSMALADAFGIRIINTYMFSKTVTVSLEDYGLQRTLALPIPVGFGKILAVVVIGLMLLGLVTSVGEILVAQKVLNNEDFGIRSLFPKRIFAKAMVMNLVKLIMISFGLMAFIVPGIVIACSYAEANFILANNPELGPIEALRCSREKMYGNRFAFVMLILSFLPWILVAILIQYVAAAAVYNLTWPGDVIYSVIMWNVEAFLLSGIKIAAVIFFRNMADSNQKHENVFKAFEEQRVKEEEQEAQAQEQRRREEMNIARAERMYKEYKCSHDLMRRDGIYTEFCELGLPTYREDLIRAAYARELMYRFDSTPDALNDIIILCSEYHMTDLTDRALARIQRYGREESIPAADILKMAKRILEMLHSGVFGEDPGFAARKQSDILNLADQVKAKAEVKDPEGTWILVYHAICSMCGIEE